MLCKGAASSRADSFCKSGSSAASVILCVFWFDFLSTNFRLRTLYAFLFPPVILAGQRILPDKLHRAFPIRPRFSPIHR